MTTPRRPSRPRALIVGGGIAGLASAYAVLRSGYDVHLVERRASARREDFVLDLYGPGYAAAEGVAIMPTLRAVGCEPSTWTLCDREGAPHLSISHATLKRRLFDGRFVSCWRSELESALRARVCHHVAMEHGVALARLGPAGPRVAASFSTGATSTYDLVVGAGGADSTSRRLWFDVTGRSRRYAGVVAAGCRIPSDSLHFELGSGYRGFSSPSAHVGIRDGGRGTVSACFTIARERPPENDLIMRPIEELRQRFAAFGGIVPRVLHAMESCGPVCFEPVYHVTLPAWSAGRLVLVGDACSGGWSEASQGAGMALAGACALGSALTMHGMDRGAAFAEYERTMRPMVARARRAGERVARWSSPRTAMLRVARDFALRASLWPLGSLGLRRALATTG
jgi:2-polyprenyl-6-methoxyphenol hydroxylase-like FAD-dependent oxidoreductase